MRDQPRPARLSASALAADLPLGLSAQSPWQPLPGGSPYQPSVGKQVPLASSLGNRNRFPKRGGRGKNCFSVIPENTNFFLGFWGHWLKGFSLENFLSWSLNGNWSTHPAQLPEDQDRDEQPGSCRPGSCPQFSAPLSRELSGSLHSDFLPPRDLSSVLGSDPGRPLRNPPCRPTLKATSRTSRCSRQRSPTRLQGSPDSHLVRALPRPGGGVLESWEAPMWTMELCLNVS